MALYNPTMGGVSLDGERRLWFDSRDPWGELTRAERAVLTVVLTGAHNREIAAALNVTEATIRSHLTHIYSKFGVDGRASLFAAIRDAGLAKIPASEPAEESAHTVWNRAAIAALVLVVVLIVLLAWAIWSGQLWILVAPERFEGHPGVREFFGPGP
jgi:DNA-binding CsgD family transcriptional regulator